MHTTMLDQWRGRWSGRAVAFSLGLAAIVCPARALAQRNDELAQARRLMVELHVQGAGITNPRVIEAMLATPRHEFVPFKLRDQAYLDAGLPIGHSQTISSPFIVAFMTEALDPQPTDRVLEIGTGSGYQAAVLSGLVAEVYTIEIVAPLGEQATEVLEKLDYDNVHVKIGDGFVGWPEHAPFDKIIVTCSPQDVPSPLVEQLKEGGIMVIPVGQRHQQSLHVLRKTNGQMTVEARHPTLFVPMTGEAEQQRDRSSDGGAPQLVNGDFEEPPDERGYMPGWYYQRLLSWESDPLAPSGQHYVKFQNDRPGLAGHVLQGFAIDGSKVSQITLGVSVRCDDVRSGLDANDLPVVALSFYDESRDEVGTAFIGPFEGSRTWSNLNHVIEVPESSREAIVRIGLFGATGSVGFDNISIRVTGTRK